jgi:hypothetical protein
MARPASVHEKKRLTLELPAPVRERLDQLRERTGAESVTEVIRRALALYDAVVSLGERDVRLLLIPRGMI